MNEKIKKVIEKLNEKNLWYNIVKSERSLVSSKDVERFTDVSSQVFKTIVMRDGDGKFFAAFLPGSSKVDLKKVEKTFGCCNLRLARAKELKENLNFAPGEVCPLLLNIPLVIDNSLSKYEKVLFGSGDVKYVIEMKIQDFLKIVTGKIDCISE